MSIFTVHFCCKSKVQGQGRCLVRCMGQTRFWLDSGLGCDGRMSERLFLRFTIRLDQRLKLF